MTTTPSRMTVREQPAFVVGDTPSTDGAPEPEEVTAAWFRDRGYSPGGAFRNAVDLLATQTAAGLRVVPEDRPAPDVILCAELRIERTDAEQSDQGAWHVDDGVQVVFFPDVIEAAYYIGTLDGLGMARERAAGVPALDDDTRREVERIVEHLRHDVDVIDQGAYEDMAQVSRSIDRAAELLAAAYGVTDG